MRGGFSVLEPSSCGVGVSSMEGLMSSMLSFKLLIDELDKFRSSARRIVEALCVGVSTCSESESTSLNKEARRSPSIASWEVPGMGLDVARVGRSISSFLSCIIGGVLMGIYSILGRSGISSLSVTGQVLHTLVWWGESLFW